MARYETKIERPTVHPELGRLEPGEEREGKNLDKRFPGLFAKPKKKTAKKKRSKAKPAKGDAD